MEDRASDRSKQVQISHPHGIVKRQVEVIRGGKSQLMNEQMTYAHLRRRAGEAGILKQSGWNYLPLALITIALGLIATVIVVVAPGWWRLLAAPAFSLFWIQVGFLGHDSGHNQVFARTSANRFLGMLCFPLTLGMTFRSWVIKHNLHHAETNIVGDDPDIEHPLLAFTEKTARSRQGFARWVARYQAFLYPLLAFGATFNFRFEAWRYAITGRTPWHSSKRYDSERRIEFFLLVGNAVLWIVVPSVLLGPVHWLPVFIIGQALLGFHMAFVFAPNHKGMEMFESGAPRPTFLELQVVTSRNVYGGPLVDFMYGGLNYQIEHHLFPTMPRTNFGACRALVRAHCANAGIPYAEESVVGSCRTLFDELNRLGHMVPGFESSDSVAGSTAQR
jgi:fatty acid desaturase